MFSCSANPKEQTKKDIPVNSESINKLHVANGIEIRYTQNGTDSIKLEGNESLLEKVTIKTEGNTLIIEGDKDFLSKKLQKSDYCIYFDFQTK